MTEADIPQLNPERVSRIRELLTSALEPESLVVTDDSHKHAGHAGARGGQGHFGVDIV
ncbi:MAG: BolA/IbaG family iron-sulfur metabolism protein, partial [Thermomonas sp.]